MPLHRSAGGGTGRGWHDGAMTAQLPACLAEPRLVAALPAFALEPATMRRAGAVLEILAQRGFRTVSLHHDNLAWLEQLRPVFEARLTFGVHGVTTREQLDNVIDQGPAFVLANNAEGALVDRGREASLTVLPAALTPNELLAAAQLGAPAVQVLPADVMGGAYAESLKHVMPADVALIPRGGLGAWAIGRWFDAGAPVCIADEGLLTDALTPSGNLGQLRDRCSSYLDTVPKPEAESANA